MGRKGGEGRTYYLITVLCLYLNCLAAPPGAVDKDDHQPGRLGHPRGSDLQHVVPVHQHHATSLHEGCSQI